MRKNPAPDPCLISHSQFIYLVCQPLSSYLSLTANAIFSPVRYHYILVVLFLVAILLFVWDLRKLARAWVHSLRRCSPAGFSSQTAIGGAQGLKNVHTWDQPGQVKYRVFI